MKKSEPVLLTLKKFEHRIELMHQDIFWLYSCIKVFLSYKENYLENSSAIGTWPNYFDIFKMLEESLLQTIVVTIDRLVIQKENSKYECLEDFLNQWTIQAESSKLPQDAPQIDPNVLKEKVKALRTKWERPIRIARNHFYAHRSIQFVNGEAKTNISFKPIDLDSLAENLKEISHTFSNEVFIKPIGEFELSALFKALRERREFRQKNGLQV